MPNNASARRGKDKKNKDKKKKDNKKTDTPPLPKEDIASVDSGTLSLSSAGKDKASKDKASTLPLEGKDVDLDLSDPRYLEKTLAARGESKAIAADGTSMDKSSLDGSSLPMVRTKGAAKIAGNIAGDPSRSDSALLLEFARSLSDRENWVIHDEVK